MKTKDNVGRLTAAFLEQVSRDMPLSEGLVEEIESRISGYRLMIVCDETIGSSVAQQAALLTAINVGKRCFKGGVFVNIDKEVASLLPWPEVNHLNEIAKLLGAKEVTEEDSVVLHLGIGKGTDSWRLLVNGWNAALVPPGSACPSFDEESNFPLGGILGGALAVSHLFLKTAGFDSGLGRDVVGLSLSRPDLNWDDPLSAGTDPLFFPEQLWLVGLGHLGQAYAWVLGLLPFGEKLVLKLQDDDEIVEGNWDSGMLCEEGHVGKYKTRIVSSWLEKRNIKTRIVEDKYDENSHRKVDDPPILLSGVDKLLVRKELKTDQMELTLDCGLGDGLNFDLIRLNYFPSIGKTPNELWPQENEPKENHSRMREWSEKFTRCGFTVGAATAFTGCISACLVISELLRSVNQGARLSHVYLSARSIMDKAVGFNGMYGYEVKTKSIAFRQP